MRTSLCLMVVSSVVAALALGASPAAARQTSEQKCQAGRFTAAATYQGCVRKLLAKDAAGTASKFQDAFVKCVAKYAAAWPKLQKKTKDTGATCDAARLIANGDGTVTDNLSGLQWEQKTDDDGVHDKDNGYTWSASGSAADGTAFTAFFPTLNGSCFAGQCDWRLPTLAELGTLIQTPCSDDACIDPIFGPTPPLFDLYWSATTDAFFPGQAWGVQHAAFVTGRGKMGLQFARAVRGGV